MSRVIVGIVGNTNAESLEVTGEFFLQFKDVLAIFRVDLDLYMMRRVSKRSEECITSVVLHK